jgi:multidrug resistance protein MdtO
MRQSGLVADLVANDPGRWPRALEISFACVMVVIVSMMFQIPDPATSAYLIFFAAKENSVLNIVMSIVLILVVTLVIGLTFGLAVLSLNAPEGRILLMAAVAFAAFFLGTASKLAPFASSMGLIIAYALDLFGSSPFGEIATRGLLYAWLFVAVPMLVFIVCNLVVGRHPAALLRQALAARLGMTADALRGMSEASRERLAESLEGGNAELLKTLRMASLLRGQPPDTAARLRALVTLSHGLALTVFAFEADEAAAAREQGLAARVDSVADAVEHLPRRVVPASREGSRSGTPAPPGDLVAQARGIVAALENVVAGGPVPEPEPAPKPEKTGFFAADAFINPDHVRFAAKGTAAMMICYLTFTLLDWPGIHTSMLTCFVVGLTTVGETMQKLTLRIVGCCVGAALGIAAMVYVLPDTTSITALAALIGLVTVPAAWIAVGRPTVAYIGFQMAFALYLCILQGAEPKFDLTIARDRTIGILFGDVVVYLIFTRVFPLSMLARLRLDLAALIARCRAVLEAVRERRPVTAAAAAVADVQALLEKLEADAAAFGYEAVRSRNGRLRGQATRLSIKALRGLVEDLGRLAVYPPPVDGVTAPADTLRRMSLEIEAQLGTLAETLAGKHEAEASPDRGADVRAPAARLKPLPLPFAEPDPTPERVGGRLSAENTRGDAQPPWSGPITRLLVLQRRLDSVGAILSHYRRLLRAEATAHV